MSIHSLKVVKPMVVTPAMVIDSNVPEDDHSAWSSGTTYADKARVIKAHKVWQSIGGGNTNNDPETSPDKWQEVGYTNRYKVFDRSVSSQTVKASTITYQLRLGMAVTSLAALNVKGATSIRVYVVDPEYGNVYDKTLVLSRVPVASGWWNWGFGERLAPTQALFTDLKGLPDADVFVEITGGSDLAVGVIVVGQLRSYSMGVRMGARVGINDYSRKERNEYGDIVVVERAFANRANFSMMLRAAEVDAVRSFLAEVRATPCLWIGSSRYESTTVYGFYKSFDIVISYFDYSDCELELEGLT